MIRQGHLLEMGMVRRDGDDKTITIHLLCNVVSFS